MSLRSLHDPNIVSPLAELEHENTFKAKLDLIAAATNSGLELKCPEITKFTHSQEVKD